MAGRIARLLGRASRPRTVVRGDPYGSPPGRVAAVQQLSIMGTRTYRRFRQSDQERAAFFARKMGIVRFAAGLLADSARRCTIVPEYQKRQGDPRSWEPINDILHTEVVNRLRNERESSADLVRARVWHDQVTGEALLCKDTDERGRAMFRVRSSLLADPAGENILVRELRGGNTMDGTAKWYPATAVQRMWNPDEEQPLLAMSAVMGVMEDLERYWALHRRTKRRAENALASNGILWIPQEAHQRLPHEMTAVGGPARPGTKLETDYYKAGKRGLEDDDAIEAFLPFLMRWRHEFGPPEMVEFPSELDGIEFRKEAVEDIARGLNYPQRLLVMGAGDGNHWSDWLMEEQFARSTLAPVLERCLWSDFTNGYYRPALRALAMKGWFSDDPERYRLGFDMTPVIVHPDQSARAVELYRIGLVDAATVLESNGFTIDDMPDPQELERFLKVMQALGAKGEPAPPGGNGGSLGGSAGTGIDAGSTKELPPAGAVAVAARPYPSELVGWLPDVD